MAYASVKEPEVGVFEAVFSPFSFAFAAFNFTLNTIDGGGGAPFWLVCAKKSLYEPELAGVFLRYLKGPVHVNFLFSFAKLLHALAQRRQEPHQQLREL